MLASCDRQCDKLKQAVPIDGIGPRYGLSADGSNDEAEILHLDEIIVRGGFGFSLWQRSWNNDKALAVLATLDVLGLSNLKDAADGNRESQILAVPRNRFVPVCGKLKVLVENMAVE